jgi:hypothetical protein
VREREIYIFILLGGALKTANIQKDVGKPCGILGT